MSIQDPWQLNLDFLSSKPTLMEPVEEDISTDATVHILDHDGCKTGRTLPVRNGVINISGARDKTCYYLISNRSRLR